MLNKDLIKKLQEDNPDADVSLVDSEDICIGYISKTNDNEVFTPMTTPQLFIENADYVECVSEYIHEEEGVLWCSHYDAPCTDKQSCEYFEEFDDR